MNNIITRICIRCGKEKPRSEFYFGTGRSGKKYSHRKCKICCIELAQERYYSLSDEDRKRKLNSENRKAYIKQYRKDHPLRCLISGAKLRSKERNIEFSISEDEIQVPEHCPYLGIPLNLTIDNGKGRGKVEWDSASLDRIDPNKGYVSGNVQVISHLANRMKNNATIDQLVTFAKNVIKIHGRD